MERSDIKVMFNTEATAENLAGYKPDAVILAMGAEPVMPEIQGIDMAVNVLDVYEKEAKAGEALVFEIGDCVRSANVYEAISEGFMAAMKII